MPILKPRKISFYVKELEVENSDMKNMLTGKTYVMHFLCICMLLIPVSAYSGYAAIVIDADTGNIIHETNANQLWFPASLTKVMTLYLTFKALNSGQIHLQDKLAASQKASNQPKSKLGLKLSESITIEQAILAVATRSANDVAFMLAEHLAKNEKSFVTKMNIQAQALGMNNTLFSNVTGLPNDKQVTTAHDMATLALAVFRNFPKYYPYFSIPDFTYKKKTYSNINQLIKLYSGTDGIKTGFTCGSGYNLMASVKRNKKRLIAVVMGIKNSQSRTKKMMTLLDKGFVDIDAAKVSRNIAEPRPKSLKSASNQLTAKQCHQIYSNASPYQNKVSGWTIIFGAFADKRLAKQIIKKVKPSMKHFINYGHAAIVKRMMGGSMLWHALWSGMKKDQAGKTCKLLWVKGEYCKVLHPSLFSEKNAQWY